MKRVVIFLLTVLWLSPAYAEVGDALDYFSLGLESSMTNKKIEYFSRALELKPDLAAAYEKRGVLYFFKEEYDKVIRDFQTYLDLAPAKAEAYRMLAMGYLKSAAYQPAIHNFTRALEIEPELASAYAYRAEAYRLMGDYDQAIVDSSRALEFDGDPRTRAIAFIARAKAYRKLGNIDQAFADSKAALNAEPSIWGISYSNPQVSRRAAPVVLIGLSFVVFLGLKQKHQFRIRVSQPVRILNSKLSPPNLSDTLKRERLLFLLSNIRKRRLTTIVTAAGYGKTTLIAQTCGFLELDHVWYRLDESDRDFITFISYLIAGIRQRLAGFGAETSQMIKKARDLDRDRETILRIFLSELEHSVTEELVVILDDYHTVQDSVEIKNTIEFLLRYLSPAVHLVLISRTDIDLPLSRLVAMREVTEITEKDLVFTSNEVEQLYLKIFDIALKPGTLEVILERTGGWVSGLILLVYSLRNNRVEDLESTLKDLKGPPEIVFKYLEENVYDTLTDDDKHFLTRTSILARVSVDICDLLMGIDNSSDILKDLEGKHLFVSAVDEGRQSYVYHHLLRNLLQIKLASELDEQARSEHHKKAAALLEGLGHHEEALDHFLVAEEFKDACRLLNTMGRELLGEGRLQLLRSYIARIPPAYLSANVDLDDGVTELLDDLPVSFPPGLRVHLLGKFRLFLDGQEIHAKRWKSKKAKTIFQFLLYSSSRGYVNKEVLMELLWPEEDPKLTAKRLHVALASLRKTLEPEIPRGTPSLYISRDNDSYSIDLGEEGRLDIEDFTEELHLAKQEDNPEKSIVHYMNAESVYQGDFLEEELYSEWCAEARDRFKEEYLWLLREIIEYCEDKGDLKNCIFYARKYLEKDKYAEDLYQLLMTTYAQTGNKAMVARTFEKCREAITTDLNCPISEETERLFQELVST
jgi:DNA-binding SARP family transcriptional activator